MFLESILSCISLPGHYKTCEHSNETPKSGGIHSLLGFELLWGHRTLDSFGTLSPGCVIVIMNNILILFISNMRTHHEGCCSCPQIPPPSSWTGLHQLVDKRGGCMWAIDHWWCGIPLLGWNVVRWLIPPTSSWVRFFKGRLIQMREFMPKMVGLTTKNPGQKSEFPKSDWETEYIIYTTPEKPELTNDIRKPTDRFPTISEHQPFFERSVFDLSKNWGLFLQRDPQERCTLRS